MDQSPNCQVFPARARLPPKPTPFPQVHTLFFLAILLPAGLLADRFLFHTLLESLIPHAHPRHRVRHPAQFTWCLWPSHQQVVLSQWAGLKTQRPSWRRSRNTRPSSSSAPCYRRFRLPLCARGYGLDTRTTAWPLTIGWPRCRWCLR